MIKKCKKNKINSIHQIIINPFKKKIKLLLIEHYSFIGSLLIEHYY